MDQYQDSIKPSQFDAQAQLSFSIAKALDKNNKNVVLSPLSIQTAMAMTMAGARRDTEQEMIAGLGYGGWTTAQIHASLSQQVQALTQSRKELLIANSVWTQKGKTILEAFQKVIRDQYLSEVCAVDFIGNADDALQRINAWVSDKTNKKIKELLSSQHVCEETRLVLVNALHFNGTWQRPFPKENTQECPFTLKDGTIIHVPTMLCEEVMHLHAQSDRVELIVLPYKSGSMMYVFAPKDHCGLDDVDAELADPQDFSRWQLALEETMLEVQLPKFKIKAKADMVGIFRELGMRAPFDHQRADFTGINGGEDPLVISAVVHEACIDVNEEGTEASAATAVPVARRLSMPTRVVINKPFKFFIINEESDAVLFQGTVRDPR